MIGFHSQGPLNQVGRFGRAMVAFVQLRQGHEGIGGFFILLDHTLKDTGCHRMMPELLATTARLR